MATMQTARKRLSTMDYPHPVTPTEWRQALHGVKALYLKGQYKQCTARCAQLLEEADETTHPLHKTVLVFYAATCLDITARALHPLASTKLEVLSVAREHYERAAATLPSAAEIITTTVTLPSPVSQSSASTPMTPANSPTSLYSSSPSSLGSLDDSRQETMKAEGEEEEEELTNTDDESDNETICLSDSLTSPTKEPPTTLSQSSISSIEIPKPSPLRIRKPHVRFTSDPLLVTPPKPLINTTTTSTTTMTSTIPDPTIPHPLTTHFTRTTTHLSSLARQIQTHIAHLDTLIASTTTSQSTRKVRFVDLRDPTEEEVRGWDRRERIERLRREGWKRVRWGERAGRYEVLRRAVEDEM
ncbi:MAG: hypothetical protein M1817_004984 [Caeruleum heppii]|nr:MAG: hypothetical protein M1817_004984 [Caeruleum heppii]